MSVELTILAYRGEHGGGEEDGLEICPLGEGRGWCALSKWNK